jgi:hypothetical protein
MGKHDFTLSSFSYRQFITCTPSMSALERISHFRGADIVTLISDEVMPQGSSQCFATFPFVWTPHPQKLSRQELSLAPSHWNTLHPLYLSVGIENFVCRTVSCHLGVSWPGDLCLVIKEKVIKIGQMNQENRKLE